MGNAHFRLRPQSVFTSVLRCGKTFEQLSMRYGLTLENFEKELLAKVGPKEFYRLKKASEENEAKTPKKEIQDEMPQIIIESEYQNDENSEEEEKEQTKVENKRMTERENWVLQKQNAERMILTLKEEVAKAEKECEAAKEKERELQRALREARNYKFDAQKRRNIKKNNLARWEECLSSIEERIKEIDSEVIYLIAPGYRGELPTVGKLISSEPFEGAIVEDGEGLYKELSVEDLLNSGFEKICDASNAYRFARLVIKYDLEGIKVNILVDDERIKRILKSQGLEI